MSELQDYTDWVEVHQVEILYDTDTQYDILDVVVEQEVFRKAGATERDIQAHGRLMMQVVERMEGYTDPIEVIGLG